jgi:hypothetical protein
VIDADELAKARLDEHWREFCLNVEHYVAKPRPSVGTVWVEYITNVMLTVEQALPHSGTRCSDGRRER